MVDAVIERFRAENVLSVSFSEVNILDNRALVEKYGDEIPVLQINGSTHAYWRIDPERLERAIRRLLTK